ncbi:hypothetical protein CYMTET_43963 [Cymbomonas tetramitiformis]|uniref:Uncharacterized protein n=1 Tax=Cymbomonas tetramitiformis TaxID=36881 RepID=A0AAE0F044_9CHLO|nr:hypothetical protein CYMTET_43963 [Cymbomonas tetramitiformis]
MLPDELRVTDKGEGEWEAMAEETMAETAQAAEGGEEEEWSEDRQDQFLLNLSAAAYSAVVTRRLERSAKTPVANQPAANTATSDEPV